ncbi:30S ribosomal protein S16 [Patescibacteria group bacterium]|nr:30S ribosomal protein S16 [Patescibacteria group bacterium]
MMLVIRLFRTGRKNQPVYKIVVTEKTNPPAAGRFVEEVGFFDPLTKERRLKPERIKEWLSKGAQPSDTVYNMLVKEGVLEGKKIPVHKKSKKAQPEAPVQELAQEQPKVEVKEEPKGKSPEPLDKS